MPEYRVAFSEGASTPNNFGGRQFRGVQHIEVFEAESRVDIFLKMHKFYTENDLELTVFCQAGKNLLDFTYDELREIYDREKITVKSGFPINGAQIQSIKIVSEFN